MPPITGHREQARLCQLCEMGAGGLRRDSRRDGELARGQGTAIEKRRHHRRSRRVSDQRRDLGDDRACDHFRYLAGAPVGRPPVGSFGSRTTARRSEAMASERVGAETRNPPAHDAERSEGSRPRAGWLGPSGQAPPRTPRSESRRPGAPSFAGRPERPASRAAWVRTRAGGSPRSRARPLWAYWTETVRSVFQMMSTLSPTLI